MIRKVLAWFIKPGEEPTNENILKYALKNYLNKAVVRAYCCGDIRFNLSNGLCIYLSDSLMHYLNVHATYCSEIQRYIPLYNNNCAVKYFKAKSSLFWWDIRDWRNRYRFMKWLIKQYKE